MLSASFLLMRLQMRNPTNPIMARAATSPTTTPAMAPGPRDEEDEEDESVLELPDPAPSAAPAAPVAAGEVLVLEVAEEAPELVVVTDVEGVAVGVLVAAMISVGVNIRELASGFLEARDDCTASREATLMLRSVSCAVLQQMLIWFLVSVHFSLPLARQHQLLVPEPQAMVEPSPWHGVEPVQHTAVGPASQQ
ncbi:hypothetical protein ACKVWC_011562 [Pyricularia oryzae]